jgi:hypothetical protein
MAIGDRNNRELVQDLLTAFNAFKHKLEDPNYIQMENSIQQIMNGQKDMRNDISDLKKQLLNPYDGVIVETRRNTEHRVESEEQKIANANLLEEHKALVRWKSNVTKIGIAVLSSVGAIIAFLLSEFVFRR